MTRLLGGNERRPHGASDASDTFAFEIRKLFESRRGEVDDATTAEGHRERDDPVRERNRGQAHGIASHHAHLVLVHLNQVEATAPRCGIRQRLQGSHPVRLDRQQQRVKIAIDRTAKVLANQLRGLEVELEPADEVDVERVEIRQQWLQSEPLPAGNASGQSLTSRFVALVIQGDAVVGIRHFDGSCSRSRSLEVGA